jgi:DNA-binding MarR family transcriptional regulator
MSFINDRKVENLGKAPPVGVAFLLSQVGAHAALGFTERLRQFGLKPYDAGILRMVGSNPGLTQQALSAILGLFPSRLVILLDGLGRRKLIDRRNSPSDRRVYQLHLTRSGREALSKIGTVTAELEEDLFGALSKSETKVLRNLLVRIISQQKVTSGAHPAYRQLGKR